MKKRMKLFYIGVKAIIVDQNKVLILKATDESGVQYLDLPGGRIDVGETELITLKRELEEELPGIKNIQIKDFIHAGQRQKDLRDGNGLMFHYYKADADCSSIGISDEHQSMEWISIDQLLEKFDDTILQPEHKKAFQKIRKIQNI